MNSLLFIRIWNYLRGYLVIKVEGLSLEKFINLCLRQGVHLWKIKRSDYTSLTACISISGFKKLHSIRRVVRCRITILDKRGFPFLAYKFRNRRMLVVGMLLFIVILYGLGSFIWVVEVEGTIKTDPQYIAKKLEEYGIKSGAFKRGIDTWTTENRMLIEIPELSWISIEIKGVKAIARVIEATKAPALVNKDVPCNIVAAKDGIIERVIALEGESMVKRGDTVRQGQLLVSGIIEHEDTGVIRYVHAMAQIMARTWYEGRSQVSFKDISGIRTGNKVTHKYYEINGWNLNINEAEIPFEKYEIEEKKTPVVGVGQVLPFYLVTREYYEIRDATVQERIEIALRKAEEKAWEDVQKKIPKGAKIIDKQFKYDMIKEEGIDATIYVEVLEDIAQQEEIAVNENMRINEDKIVD